MKCVICKEELVLTKIKEPMGIHTPIGGGYVRPTIFEYLYCPICGIIYQKIEKGGSDGSEN